MLALKGPWFEVELRARKGKPATKAYLAKSKSSSRAVVRAADDGDAARSWEEQ